VKKGKERLVILGDGFTVAMHIRDVSFESAGWSAGPSVTWELTASTLLDIVFEAKNTPLALEDYLGVSLSERD